MARPRAISGAVPQCGRRNNLTPKAGDQIAHVSGVALVLRFVEVVAQMRDELRVRGMVG